MKSWLLRNRSSTRVAFLLYTVQRIVSASTSLVWTPLLLHAMGAPLYGVFVSFQAVATMGSLGDLGMGGAVTLAVGRFLGSGDEEAARRFLSVARTAFIALAVAIGAAFFLVSPWMPRVLGFEPVPKSGSLVALFALAAPVLALTILCSYWSNLNYAAANLTWPVLPSLLLSQMALAGHWILARRDAPLWIQYLPYAMTALAGLLLFWLYLRVSHRELAGWRPLCFDANEFKTLVVQSGWVYLMALGTTVYFTTDRLVINAGLGPTAVPSYQLNYKVCEIALSAIMIAGFVTMPKLIQWLASPDPAVQARARTEAVRLNRFVCFLGSAAAVVYLGANDTFISLWIGKAYLVPMSWQAAFALNLAVTAGANIALNLAMRSNASGLRYAGTSVAAAAVLNFGMSVAAIYFWKSPLGVALATVVAQSAQAVVTANFVTRWLGVSRSRWWLDTMLWPLLATACAVALRWSFAAHGLLPEAIYAAGTLAIITGLAAIYGIDREFILGEWRALTGRSLKRG